MSSSSAPSRAVKRWAVVAEMWHEICRIASRRVVGASRAGSSISTHLYWVSVSMPKSMSPRWARSASIRGSSGGDADGRSEVASTAEATTIDWPKALTRVDQHSCASCCFHGPLFGIRSANAGNDARKTLTNETGVTSCAAFARSSCVIRSRIAKTNSFPCAAPAPENFWSEVESSGMIFMHCSVELR